MKTWIMVANASEAYLYSSDNLRTKDIKLIKELLHPESREKGSDLVTDRPGHYQGSRMARGAYEKNPIHAIEAEVFAKELSEVLRNGLNQNKYEHLLVIAAPQFYGLINKHLDFVPAEFNHIPKDYTKLKAHDLLEQVRKSVFG